MATVSIVHRQSCSVAYLDAHRCTCATKGDMILSMHFAAPHAVHVEAVTAPVSE